MLGLTLVAGLLTTGVATANAAPQEFRGGGDRGFHQVDRGFRGDRDYRVVDHRYDRGYDRGYGYRGGFGVGVDVNYVPPCPGPGYAWTAGYWNGGIWVPGTWILRGGPGFVAGYGYRERGFDRGWDRGSKADADSKVDAALNMAAVN
jgi:hypothetical protein